MNLNSETNSSYFEVLSRFGLSKRSGKIIREIITPYSQKIVRVNIFGSRAMGNFSNNSDIDLVVYGEISSEEVRRISAIFYESSLPVKVDIVKYEDITHKPFKAHIDKEAKVFLIPDKRQQSLL